MDESHKIKLSGKKKQKQRVYIIRFHLHKVHTSKTYV